MRIRIRYSLVLDNLFKQLQSPADYPEAENTLLLIEEFRSHWDRLESQILNALQQILGVNFVNPILDAFIVGEAPNSISTPIVIHTKMDKDRFIYVLAHELIHVLLSDNAEGVDFPEKLKNLYPNETWKTRNHIAVHAVLEKVFTELIPKPEYLIKDKEFCKNKPAYAKAWAVVSQEGYGNIINKLLM